MASSGFEQGAKPELTPEQLEQLIHDLGSPEGYVRHRADRALEEVGSAAVSGVPYMVELLEDTDRNVRFHAARVLRYTGPAAAAAAPALAKALYDDDNNVRYSAADALRRIGLAAAVAVPALIEALEDKDSDVRRATAEALGGIAAGMEDNARKTDVSELMGTFSLWQNALTRLDTMDSKNTNYPEEFEQSRDSVRRLVEALQAAQAGNLTPGPSP